MHDAFGVISRKWQSPTIKNTILNDPPIIHKLKIELAITVDTGEPFVKATYCMERDGPLVFSRSVPFALLFQIHSIQNVKAIADKLAGGVASHTVINW